MILSVEQLGSFGIVNNHFKGSCFLQSTISPGFLYVSCMCLCSKVFVLFFGYI